MLFTGVQCFSHLGIFMWQFWKIMDIVSVLLKWCIEIVCFIWQTVLKIQFIIRYDKEKHQLLIFEKVEPVNFGTFAWKIKQLLLIVAEYFFCRSTNQFTNRNSFFVWYHCYCRKRVMGCLVIHTLVLAVSMLLTFPLLAFRSKWTLRWTRSWRLVSSARGTWPSASQRASCLVSQERAVETYQRGFK